MGCFDTVKYQIVLSAECLGTGSTAIMSNKKQIEVDGVIDEF